MAGTRAKSGPNPGKTAIETPQRARKRALDREAQRTFREKTKNYISHLEKTVEACKTGDQSQLVERLLTQQAELYSTVERLQRRLCDIHAMTLPENVTLGTGRASGKLGRSSGKDQDASLVPPTSSPSRDQILTSSNDDAQGDAEDETAAIRSPLSMEPVPTVISVPSPSEVVAAPTSLRFNTHDPLSPPSEPAETTDMVMSAYFTDCSRWNEVAAGRNYGCTPEANDTTRLMMNNPSAMLGHFSEMDTAMTFEALFSTCTQEQNSAMFTSSMEESDIWATTNDVYNRILDVSLLEAVTACAPSPGYIFRAIKHGWEALSPEDQANPVCRILRSYDDLVHDKMDQVNRAAIAYKNHLLINYYLNLEDEDLEQMPHWIRPTDAQRSKKHAILIDFFAWPALRERFIYGQMSFNNHKFGVAYIKHFKFLWPFAFEDTYRYQPATDTYCVSPLFERHHRELRNWSMDQAFFYEFPELADCMANTRCRRIGQSLARIGQ